MPLVETNQTRLDLPVRNQAGDHALGSDDAGVELAFIADAAGSATLSLASATQAGNGFTVLVSNRRAASLVVTVQAYEGEEVDGASSISIASGDSRWLACDGAGWRTMVADVKASTTTPGTARLATQAEVDTGTSTDTIVTPATLAGSTGGGGGGMTLLSVVDAASSQYAEFTTNIDSTYDVYMIVGSGIHYDSNVGAMLCQMGTSTGPTWQTGATYQWGYSGIVNGSASNSYSNTTTSITIAPGTIQGGVTEYDRVCSMIVWLHQPSNTTYGTTINWQWTNQQLGYDSVQGGGVLALQAATTAIRFFVSGQNHAAGHYRLYGLNSSLS